MSKDGNGTRGPDISDSTAQKRPTSGVEKCGCRPMWPCDKHPDVEGFDEDELRACVLTLLEDNRRLNAIIEADREGREGASVCPTCGFPGPPRVPASPEPDKETP